MNNPFNALYDGTGAFRVDCVVRGETRYASNALTFEKAEDADAYARDLYCRWTMLADWRVVPASTPEREEIVPEKDTGS
jgi:hypothetical protein